MKWAAEPLAEILDKGVKRAEKTIISNAGFLKVFGANIKSLSTAGELWAHIFDRLESRSMLKKRKNELDILLGNGSLSTRILRSLKGDHSKASLMQTYKQLSKCLSENRMFNP